MSIPYQIERLLNFASQKELIFADDIIPSRNILLDLLKISEPYSFAPNEIIVETLETATDILSKILDHCADKRIISDNTMTYRELMASKIMGLLMPRSSEFNARFYELYKKDKKTATNYFYSLSRYSNYIQVDRIKKNLYWKSPTTFGDLELTINLSKPEKDPKEIAAAKSLPQTSYPKCLLCPENEGFAGHLNHPARQNLRLKSLILDNEDWYMQYSPYVYYNEHCIVLSKNHVPMKTTKNTFCRLLDFVEYFPHYFIGSNADIPIVGGSILTHDHYQGGNHTFPMEVAKSFAEYTHKDYGGINISLVKWPLSVIRISGNDKSDLVKLAMFVMNSWKPYSDESADIISFTGDTPHNAITPIARKNKDGLFELDLVLRNNRTSDEHPFGIFHPHEELHHIKKENIGLIEVMGLAVLPGRLSGELDDIANLLCDKEAYSKAGLEKPSHSLNKHLNWIKYLALTHGFENNKQSAEELVHLEVALIFSKVLQDAGVYKYTKAGNSQFNKFMTSCLFELKHV